MEKCGLLWCPRTVTVQLWI